MAGFAGLLPDFTGIYMYIKIKSNVQASLSSLFSATHTICLPNKKRRHYVLRTSNLFIKDKC